MLHFKPETSYIKHRTCELRLCIASLKLGISDFKPEILQMKRRKAEEKLVI